MDLDALRYTGSMTSPFQGNVQFDRHPTEGESGFSALREYRNPSPRGQSRTREAQPPQSGELFGIDVTVGLFGMQAGSYGGVRSVMFESPGQSGRPTLQANAVRGPSPGPRPRSRSVSPSRWGVRLWEVEALWREMDTRITGEGEVGMGLESRW